jgi:hypothetical protein
MTDTTQGCAAVDFSSLQGKIHVTLTPKGAIPMFIRTCLLFCLLTAIAFAPLAISQGTPGGKTEIITGFTPLNVTELQLGTVRLFDGFSTYGWKENADLKVENGRLYFPRDVVYVNDDTPVWFFDRTVWRTNIDTDPPAAPGQVLPRVECATAFTISPNSVFVMKPLFDGKTLDGWTIRGSAEAEVKDGVIRLTKGSGSLESEGKYGDFILQLEFFTPVRPEGKGVNSGVFFRCMPGEVKAMDGYECQILNKPGENDYKSFIGTDTGGIFRRQVGRNVGPKDGEWTYLTIAARGKRMATWVNGIQVTDWTDERNPHENPRNGCRVEAGTIQFQGHDPETEILFRNIRVREL